MWVVIFKKKTNLLWADQAASRVSPSPGLKISCCLGGGRGCCWRLLENWGSSWCESSSGRDFKAQPHSFPSDHVLPVPFHVPLHPSVGWGEGRRAALGLRQRPQWVHWPSLVALKVYMNVSGVCPWSSIHLSGCGGDGALGWAVGCRELRPLCAAAFPWVLPGALVRSDNERSLPARLPAVPACMAPTHPFSCPCRLSVPSPSLPRDRHPPPGGA